MRAKNTRVSLFGYGFGRWLAAFSLLALTACGEGGGGESSLAPTAEVPAGAVLEGVFLDSPVAGLRYQTASLSGQTDGQGVFRYRAGESVAFFLQDLPLGEATAAAVLTPIELVPGARDATDPKVTNLCILLQSLDEDGDPANGIVLSAAAQRVAGGSPINLDQAPELFLADPATTSLLAALQSGGAINGGSRTLRTVEEARGHFQTTLNQFDRDGDGYSPARGDCDDRNDRVHPGAVEICGDGIDQDCSGGDSICPGNETTFDSRLLQLIGSYRSQSGLGPLAFDPHLHDLAREHSQAMLAGGIMSHNGFNDRFNRSGYRTCVENVGWNYPTPEAMFEGWRNSSGHNSNMLNARIGAAGVSRVGAYITFFACGN